MSPDEHDEPGDAGGDLGDGSEMGELFGSDVDLDEPAGELGQSGSRMDDEIDPGETELNEGPAR